MKRIAVLISGRGSNMEALLRAQLPVDFVSVLSNVASAKGLDIARAHGVPTEVVDHRAFTTREAFDAALLARVNAHAPDLVVLAGFMRILTRTFVAPLEGRLINIHPSLLPAFQGVNTHRRALDEGVKIHGCTVHFVTPELDRGPIIAQAAVPVLDDDTEATLAARVLAQEHRLLPAVVRWYVEGQVQLAGSHVRTGHVRHADHCLCSPPPP